MSKFTLRMNKDWDEEFYRNDEMREEIEIQTADITKLAIASAPRASTTANNWNTIRKNISAFVAEDGQGFYGNVIIEPDDRVRHAGLQEFGWTSRSGVRHPGRLYLKKALERARIE